MLITRGRTFNPNLRKRCLTEAEVRADSVKPPTYKSFAGFGESDHKSNSNITPGNLARRASESLWRGPEKGRVVRAMGRD